LIRDIERKMSDPDNELFIMLDRAKRIHAQQRKDKLNETVLRSENVSGVKVKEVYVDQGYRGHDYVGAAQVYKQGGRLKRLTRAVKRKLKRRSVIEPTIGHLKTDNRMSRNFLKGAEGDRINAIWQTPCTICGS